MNKRMTVAFLSLVLCRGVEATIENPTSTDARSLSMGGASTAVANDASASLANPAILGFMARPTESHADNNGLGEQRFGWNVIDLGVEATLTGELGDYLSVLGSVDFSNFEPDQLKQSDNVENLLALTSAIGNVGDDDTIVLNASVGTSVQMGHFGIGVRTYSQLGGWINNLDLAKIGLTAAASEIATHLRDALGSEGGLPSDYTPQSLTGAQQQQLEDAFGGGAVNDVVNYIDSKVTELVENGTIDPTQIKGAVDTLSSILESSGTGTDLLSENRTSITGRAFVGVEVPVSYGYALNDNLSFGATVKAMFGRVYGTQVWVFNESNTDVLEDTLDSYNDSVNVGLDLGMMYRIPKAQFALTGHNLNRPTFDGYDQILLLNGTPTTVKVPDVTLDPQLTLGAAWFPLKRLMLASDFELLETGTLLNNYNVQRFSVGTELDLSFLALRLGTYKNIAESDYGWILTGGLGFKLWALSVDLGAAISIDDTVEFDGSEYPRTARLNAAIGMDF